MTSQIERTVKGDGSLPALAATETTETYLARVALHAGHQQALRLRASGAFNRALERPEHGARFTISTLKGKVCVSLVCQVGKDNDKIEVLVSATRCGNHLLMMDPFSEIAQQIVAQEKLQAMMRNEFTGGTEDYGVPEYPSFMNPAYQQEGAVACYFLNRPPSEPSIE